MIKHSICNKIEESGKTFRIQTKIGEMSLSLILLEETEQSLDAYKSSVNAQNLKKQADILRLSPDEYFKKLIHYLENPDKIEFAFDKGILIIKEAINDHIQVKYFQCQLIRVSNVSSIVGEYVDELTSQTTELKEAGFYFQQQTDILKTENELYKIKFTELVQRKNTDDKVMLNNFVSLLNEKKKRVQHFRSLLQAFNNYPSLANPAEVNLNTRKKRKLIELTVDPPQKHIKEEVSDSDSNTSDVGYKTSDDEKCCDIPTAISTEEKLGSKYLDDIFDESPPVKLAPIPKVPLERNNENYDMFAASTSKMTADSKALDCSVKEENSLQLPDVPSRVPSTQEWLDEL